MKLSEIYNQHVYNSNPIILTKFRKFFGNSHGLKILDVGCGSGEMSSILAKNNEVFGFDISLKSMKVAESRGIIVKKVNIESHFPCKDKFFDVVICSEILEHVFDPQSVIAEAYRVTKDDGNIFVSVPNFYSIINRIKILSGRHKGIEIPDTTAVEHIRLYSHKSLRELVESAGFKVVHQEGMGFHPLHDGIMRKFFEGTIPTLCDGIMIIGKKI